MTPLVRPASPPTSGQEKRPGADTPELATAPADTGECVDSCPEHHQPSLWLEHEWTGEIPVPYGVIPY